MITDVAYILNPMFKEKFSLCEFHPFSMFYLSLLTHKKNTFPSTEKVACPPLSQIHQKIIQAHPYKKTLSTLLRKPCFVAVHCHTSCEEAMMQDTIKSRLSFLATNT